VDGVGGQFLAGASTLLALRSAWEKACITGLLPTMPWCSSESGRAGGGLSS